LRVAGIPVDGYMGQKHVKTYLGEIHKKKSVEQLRGCPIELSLFSEPTKQAGQYKSCVSLT